MGRGEATSTPSPSVPRRLSSPSTGVLAAADIEEFTRTTTFQIMQSLRLDYGVGVSAPAQP
jgi:hypothetical protein